MVPRRLALPLLLLTLAAGGSAQDLRELEVTSALSVPFRGAQAARSVGLLFQRDSPEVVVLLWRLELLDAEGQVRRTWHGERVLSESAMKVPLHWDGRDEDGAPVVAGNYTLRMTSTPLATEAYNGLPRAHRAQRVDEALTLTEAVVDVQEAPFQVGQVPVPKVAPMPSLGPSGRRGDTQELTATAAIPGFNYTIHYGNLHSHTNHSDGGTAIAACSGSESPQAGAYGPADAYGYMKNTAKGDFLLASEHNHMYDGSSGTNTSASPAAARALFESGVAAAASFSTSNPGFLALYGVEWGTLATGAGHMNILNPDGLPGWEVNTAGEVFGHYNTPKADYASLYTLMRSRGWVGMFNHPSTSQFTVNGTAMGFTADGGEVMALCEVLNTKAFSINTTETETSRSTYTSAWNRALERGYRLAPASDQDNHCANWGMSYTNRTGVLLPAGAPLNNANFLDALRARRVFATMDRSSQLVFLANDQIMGSRLRNEGALNLQVLYASSGGHSVTRVQIQEGVPGRNGTVSTLVETPTHSFTPSLGAHFYYAKLTQEDGDLLWSAPIWVEQVGPLLRDGLE